LFGVFGLFGPAIICLAVVNLKLALIVYLLKLTLQSLSVYLLEYKMEVKKNFDYLLAYEVYSIFIAISTQVYFMFPSKVNWKNRQY
jgi:hypothetical protein